MLKFYTDGASTMKKINNDLMFQIEKLKNKGIENVLQKMWSTSSW